MLAGTQEEASRVKQSRSMTWPVWAALVGKELASLGSAPREGSPCPVKALQSPSYLYREIW